MSYTLTIRNVVFGDLDDPYYEVERGLQLDILPSLKGSPVIITGRHGSIDIRKYLETRDLNISMVLDGEKEKDIEELKDEFLRVLDITGDPIPIVISEFEGYVFYTKVVSIDLTQWVNAVRLEIYLKMHDPYLYELDIHLLNGNGTIELNKEAVYHLELDGPATDPHITIGDTTLEFEGGVGSEETLTIKPDLITKGEENVLPFLYGDPPLLLPEGSTNISTTDGTLKTYYRRRSVFPTKEVS